MSEYGRAEQSAAEALDRLASGLAETILSVNDEYDEEEWLDIQIRVLSKALAISEAYAASLRVANSRSKP